MKALFSIFVGIAAAAAATFLHLFAPPFGLIVATLGTFTAIWSIGRKYGKRRYKFWATLAWVAIFSRAADFGVGQEIFIQGNSLGNYFLFFSFLAITLALALPAN